jgi:putative acetyltransferase
MDIRVREEVPGDRAEVREVHRLAFGQDDEGRLVDALRDEGFARVSLVAEAAGRVVGHILFSDMSIMTPTGPVGALALAPLAVVPEAQRRGIGSRLVREGLAICAEGSHRVVLVVGHPGFYPRFGFSAELARRLSSPYAGPAFQARELVAGALDGISGAVVYPSPFERP